MMTTVKMTITMTIVQTITTMVIVHTEKKNTSNGSQPKSRRKRDGKDCLRRHIQ